MVPRAELDAALVDHARAQGVDVREGATVTAIDDDGTSVCVDARRRHRADRPLRDRGRRSLLPRPPAARRRIRVDGLGAGTRSASTSPASTTVASGCCSRRISSPGTRGCSRWATDRANVGFGVLKTADGVDQRQGARGAVARPRRPSEPAPGILGPRAEPEGSVRAWPIPAGYDRDRLTRGRVLFAGDAASVVDPDDRRGHRAGARERCARGARRSPRHRGMRLQSARATAPTSTARSAPTSGSRRCSSTCCGFRSARAPPSAPRPSRRGRAATSPAGCSRTIPAPSCSRPAGGTAACSRRPRRGLLPTLVTWPSLTTG